jgi:hypothetical protein
LWAGSGSLPLLDGGVRDGYVNALELALGGHLRVASSLNLAGSAPLLPVAAVARSGAEFALRGALSRGRRMRITWAWAITRDCRRT